MTWAILLKNFAERHFYWEFSNQKIWCHKVRLCYYKCFLIFLKFQYETLICKFGNIWFLIVFFLLGSKLFRLVNGSFYNPKKMFRTSIEKPEKGWSPISKYIYFLKYFMLKYPLYVIFIRKKITNNNKNIEVLKIR